MSNLIREIELPKLQLHPKVETGTTKIGKDFGLFIRGDDCLTYSECLESILTKREDRVSKTDLIVLGELLEFLRLTHKSFGEYLKKRENESIDGLESMSLVQLDQEINKRKEMLLQLVENIYPALVQDQIAILEKRKAFLEYEFIMS